MDKLITYLKYQFGDWIKAHVELEPQEGKFSEFPKTLSPKLIEVLKEQGIQKLYSHQAIAFEEIQNGNSTLMVSRTASGKTLSFFLPILDDYIKTKKGFSVMMLYPTKALSRDQEGVIQKMMKEVFTENKIGVYDGDTPQDVRESIRSKADFMITNPDMLHSGILPNHPRKWRNFLSRLKYIVIDEVHTYRGAFGSHVANVFKRLLRVCEFHGSNPIFICSSATIGNPKEHVEALLGRSISIISEDGSPRPKRNLIFMNPPVRITKENKEERLSTTTAICKILDFSVKNDIRSITFCRKRQEVERTYNAVVESSFFTRGKIRPYRGGLLPSERRQLEDDLFQGRLNGIISTNALELGINIGDLDLCILAGHPGTIASYWQRGGRVGRSGRDSVVLLIAKDTPIDQYIVNHSDFLIQASLEQAWLNANNPYILLQHLPCAAYEKPLEKAEALYSSSLYRHAVEILQNDGTIVPFHGSFLYSRSDYPTKGVNLRGMTDYNVVIYHDGKAIGEVDPIGAMGTLYKDAIYQHLGKKYMSMELNMEKKLCRVELSNVDYYTEASWQSTIQMTETYNTIDVNEAQLEFGAINVNKQPKLYKKIKERSRDNVGYGPITLPPFIYDTTGFRLHPPQKWIDAVRPKGDFIEPLGAKGLSYILKRSAPILCMADVSDIDTDVSLMNLSGTEWTNAIYVYDTHEGGVGFAEKICEKIQESLKLCEDIIDDCECKFGCPACVPPQLPETVDAELYKYILFSNATIECTKSLVHVLVTGEIILPQIQTIELKEFATEEEQEESKEEAKIKVQLNRAAAILSKKRERIH